MAQIKCEYGLTVKLENQRKFDNNQNSCLEIDELNKLSLPNSKNTGSLDLFSLDVINRDNNKALDIFFALEDEVKIRFFRNSTKGEIYSFGKLLSEQKPEHLNDFTKIYIELISNNSGPVTRIRQRFNSSKKALAFIDSLPSSRFKPQVDPKLITSLNYEDVNIALSKGLKKDSQIIAFGEVHPQINFNGTTAHSIFSKKIIPALSDKYKNLVLEFLPHNIAQSELDHYMKTGNISKRHTPELIASLSILQDNGISTLEILEAARANNIKVYGGGPSLSELALIILNIADKNRFEMTKDNSASQLSVIVEGEERAIFYGGSSHNNLNGKPQTWSFGKKLASDFTYTEIDIVVPDDHITEIKNKGANAQNGIINLKTYKNHIDHTSGIQLAKSREGSFALILPRKTE